MTADLTEMERAQLKLAMVALNATHARISRILEGTDMPELVQGFDVVMGLLAEVNRLTLGTIEAYVTRIRPAAEGDGP